MNKTHWKKLENPDYLGAYALEPGKDMIVTIKSVGQEEVYNPSNNKKETCTVAHFVEKGIKPMILNVTNNKTISKLYDTPYIEDWAGKRIAIYIAKVKAFGETVEALRIRKQIPIIEKIICQDCGKEVFGVAGHSAKEIADVGKKQFGKIVCTECAKKLAQQKGDNSAQ